MTPSAPRAMTRPTPAANSRWGGWIDDALPFLALLIMLFYVAQWFFFFPYVGFRHTISRGVIDHVYESNGGLLRDGDRVLSFNGRDYQAYLADYSIVLFDDVQPGDIVPLVVERGGETVAIDWTVPGPTTAEIEGRLTNQWWLAFAFWLAGAVVWLSVRPRDLRRRLLILFNLVTAIWFVASPMANYHVAGSMFVFKVAMWFSLPVYLHLHWEFPSRLYPLPRWVWGILYGVAGVVAVLEVFQAVPQDLHFLSFFAGAGGSVVLVIWRAVRRPAERRLIAPLGLALLLATLIPLLGLIPLLLGIAVPSYVAGGTLMTLAALPGAYVYAILQQQLGPRAPRLRRLLPAYLALVAVGVLIIGSMTLFTGVIRQAPPPVANSLSALFIALTILLVSFVPLVSLATMASALQTPLSPEHMGFRASRLFAPFMFGIGWAVLVVLLAILLTLLLPFEGSSILIGLVAAASTAVAIYWLYGPFARLVNQRLLGIPRIAEETRLRFASRIAAHMTRRGLTRLLTEELLPALLIRQSALILLPRKEDLGRKQSLFYTQGLDETQLPTRADGAWLRDVTAARSDNPALAWVRHRFNLRVGGDLVGVWLLGKREPDNYYSEPEIESLQLLADQLAVAAIHITQSELLRDLYTANIDQQERARRHLAGELHDEVLSRLAALRMYADDGAVPPQFDAAFDELTTRIRHTISGLRPALLTYGLDSALAELVEGLRERNGDVPALQLTVSGEPYRLPRRIEEHLFRIVQQAADNSLQHAQAQTIRMEVAYLPPALRLRIEDDGRGIDFDVLEQLPQLVARHHFGLAGMVERAALIGATIRIEPRRVGGTRVELVWRPAPDA